MQFTLTSTILSLLALAAAAPAPAPDASCANSIIFKGTFSKGDGLANLNTQFGSVHCFNNQAFAGNPYSPANAPNSPFYFACDDNRASSASFVNGGSTGTVYYYKAGGGSYTYTATATVDGNGVLQFQQQTLCPL